YLRTRRGAYAERNAVFLPMVYRADMSISQDVGRSIGGRPNRVQIRLDILNVTNLLDHNWGVAQDFVTLQPLISAGVDANAAPKNRFGTHAANAGGSAPPEPTALDSWNMSRSTNVVARQTATPHAVPLRGVEIASGAPKRATIMHANGTESLSARSTRSFRVSDPERANASM